jgi:hypothetical protein
MRNWMTKPNLLCNLSGGRILIKRNSKEIWREVSLIPRSMVSNTLPPRQLFSVLEGCGLLPLAYGTWHVCRYITRVLGRLWRVNFDSPRKRRVHNLDHDDTWHPHPSPNHPQILGNDWRPFVQNIYARSTCHGDPAPCFIPSCQVKWLLY